MSTFSGIINYHDKNDSFDWNVVVSGSGTYKYYTILPYGSAAHFKNHPNAPSSTQWVELVGDGVTQLGNLLPSGASLDLKLTGNRTVTIPAGSTAAQIQALIDAEPIDLNGYTLTFQFEDGSYSIDSNLLFRSFRGGTLSIYGNASDIAVDTNKSVSLNVDSDIRIRFANCTSAIEFFYIRVYAPFSTALSTPLTSFEGCSSTFTRYCAFGGQDPGYGHISYTRSLGNVRDSFFNKTGYSISSSTASTVSVQGCTFTSSVNTEVRGDRALILLDGTTSKYIESGAGSVRDLGGFKS